MSQKTTLLIFTDGRLEYFKRMFSSFEANLRGEISHVVITDDSADKRYAEEIEHLFPKFRDVATEIIHHDNRLGFARAIDSAWKMAPTTDYYIHAEDDFVFNKPFVFDRVNAILAACPHLVQIALMRQPWNEDEKKHGGIWQWHSTRGIEFEQQYLPTWLGREYWYEHMGWFTTNPCVYPRWIVERGWPTNEGAGEGKLMRELLAEDPRRRAAYWGHMNDKPLVEHIGYGRKGIGY